MSESKKEGSFEVTSGLAKAALAARISGGNGGRGDRHDLEMLQYEHSVDRVLTGLETACSEHHRVKRVERDEDELNVVFKLPVLAPGGETWVLKAAPAVGGTVVTACVVRGFTYTRSAAAGDRGNVRQILERADTTLAEATPSSAANPLVTPEFGKKHADLVPQVMSALDHAERCGAAGNAVAEELAIRRAERFAPRPIGRADERADWIAAEIEARIHAGLLRRGVEVLGEIGEDLTLMSDRIVCRRRVEDVQENTVRPLDGDVRATVEAFEDSGTLARPSFARGAVRSLLPKRRNFVLDHPQWRLAVPIDPAAIKKVEELAALVNSVSDRSPRGEGVWRPAPSGTSLGAATASAAGATAASVAGQLKDLAALHRDGALTDEEFTSAKAKLLEGS